MKKTPKHCSIDLDNWKFELNENKITTNSRWISGLSDTPNGGNFLIPKRDYLPKPSSEHHGIWIAEIPYQMITRFTKEGDIVWSQFGGSGVDYEVAKYLKRECIINDLNPQLPYIQKADSKTLELEPVDMILSHPPYWDMVKYSDDDNDGSSIEKLTDFITWWQQIVNNSIKNLKDNGYFILACGNLYKNSEEIELGEMLKNVLLMNGFILKQHIIKDYGETKGGAGKDYNINYYRQLKGGYGNFYGDNIYVLKKVKSKNNIVEIYKKIIENKIDIPL